VTPADRISNVHDDASELLRELVSHRLPATVLREARAAGAHRAALYVIDIDGSCLIKLAGDEQFPELFQAPLGGGPELPSETIGEVQDIVASKIPEARLVPLWVRDRAVGVLVACGGASGDLRGLADQAALALELGSGYTDVIHRARRRKEIDAAAEIQQDLLPPRIATVEGAHIAAGVLPGYEVGGDFFDYAENDDGLWLAVGDAMGKGNTAAAISSLAVGALRAARRNDATLEQAAQIVHEASFELGGPYQFLTAVFAVWHHETGTLATAASASWSTKGLTRSGCFGTSAAFAARSSACNRGSGSCSIRTASPNVATAPASCSGWSASRIRCGRARTPRPPARSVRCDTRCSASPHARCATTPPSCSSTPIRRDSADACGRERPPARTFRAQASVLTEPALSAALSASRSPCR
jgi:hypothetical protein